MFKNSIHTEGKNHSFPLQICMTSWEFEFYTYVKNNCGYFIFIYFEILFQLKKTYSIFKENIN